MKPIWQDLLSEHDKKCLANQSSMSPMHGLGKNPALVIVDMQVGICGMDGPIYEHQDKYPASCGSWAWTAIRHLQKMIPFCRQRNIPIVFTRFVYTPESGFVKPATYMFRSDNPMSELVAELQPEKGDIVIEKNRASAFFQTGLICSLLNKKVDTVLLAGNTTSGCIRATAIDATGYMFNTALIEECVFDRLEMAHKSSMFDLSFKYCDVLDVDATYKYLNEVTS